MYFKAYLDRIPASWYSGPRKEANLKSAGYTHRLVSDSGVACGYLSLSKTPLYRDQVKYVVPAFWKLEEL